MSSPGKLSRMPVLHNMCVCEIERGREREIWEVGVQLYTYLTLAIDNSVYFSFSFREPPAFLLCTDCRFWSARA